ncbi:putative Transmembrane protein, partial [Quillaja saponaria]
MHRSASWNRVTSDDYNYIHSTSPAMPGLKLSSSLDGNDLPVYDPIADLAKKEKTRIKFAENAVHVIPFVLFLCAIALWFFSNPEVEVGLKGDSIATRIEGLTLEGEFDNDSDGTQIGVLPNMDAGDIDASRELDYNKAQKKP